MPSAYFAATGATAAGAAGAGAAGAGAAAAGAAAGAGVAVFASDLEQPVKTNREIKTTAESTANTFFLMIINS